MQKQYTVDVSIDGKVVGQLMVHAETSEEAEDMASELITLTAK